MELKRKGGRSAEATERELHNKLVRTQAELAKWQTIQRHESYHTMPVPGTEAETTLRFLKDAVFHFLTTDKKDSDEHLRAIVRILRFSDTQREKIAHAIILKRNKHGWWWGWRKSLVCLRYGVRGLVFAVIAELMVWNCLKVSPWISVCLRFLSERWFV